MLEHHRTSWPVIWRSLLESIDYEAIRHVNDYPVRLNNQLNHRINRGIIIGHYSHLQSNELLLRKNRHQLLFLIFRLDALQMRRQVLEFPIESRRIISDFISLSEARFAVSWNEWWYRFQRWYNDICRDNIVNSFPFINTLALLLFWTFRNNTYHRRVIKRILNDTKTTKFWRQFANR